VNHGKLNSNFSVGIYVNIYINKVLMAGNYKRDVVNVYVDKSDS